MTAIDNDIVEGPSQVKRIRKSIEDESSNESTIVVFQLNEIGSNASIDCNVDEQKQPLQSTDLKDLIKELYIRRDNQLSWCELKKLNSLAQTFILLFDGICIDNWTNNKKCFKHTKKIFKDILEIYPPADEKLLKSLMNFTEVGDNNTFKPLDVKSRVIELMKVVCPFIKQVEEELDNLGNENDNFSRTKLLLSSLQMIQENYPLPFKGNFQDIYSDYVMTKDYYAPVTPDSPMFAVDCEMCITENGSELTRISIVNENYESVYESLVKPHNKIINYLTQYSGITKQMMEDVTKRLEDVQNDIRNFLPRNAILVGQSLNSDLHALKMMHPYVIDTSVIFNLSGDRVRKSKLKILAQVFLEEKIQVGKSGHCSFEDSLTSLKLVQLKLNHKIEFGDRVLNKKLNNKKNNLDNSPLNEFLNYDLLHENVPKLLGSEVLINEWKQFQLKNDGRVFCFDKGVTFVPTDADMDVEKVINMNKNCKFIIMQENVKLDENKSSKLQDIDRLIFKVFNSLPSNAFLIVVFGGNNDSNGLVFVKVKDD